MNLFLRLLEYVSTEPEQIILILRITSVVAVLLAICSTFRIIYLNNSLSISEAKKYLAIRSNPISATKEPDTPKMEVYVEPIQPKQKREPISFTISEEAQALLDKFTVSVNCASGWIGYPEAETIKE